MMRIKGPKSGWGLLSVLCLLSLSVLNLPAQAAEQVQGLYDVELAVDSQSQSQRMRAASIGLRTVLVRLSGNPSVLDNDEVRLVARKPERFLNQFSYYEQPAEDEGQPQLMIKMEFESSLVEDLLRAQSLPIWSSNRPSVLLWLAADGPEGRHIVSAADSKLAASIEQQARRRGLVVKLPLLDLEDITAINPEEVWQLNAWVAERASLRYQADSILMGRISELSNGEWIGSWLFSNAGERAKLASQQPDLNTYVGEIMDIVADQLSAKYAVVPVKMSEGGVVMRLTGIDNFSDYARAVDYLQQLSAIRYVNPMHIEGHEMYVQLIADGQLQQLEQSLALGKRLEKIPALDALAAQSYPAAQLNYHWPDQ